MQLAYFLLVEPMLPISSRQAVALASATIGVALAFLWLNARSHAFLNCDMECGETALAIRAAKQFATYGIQYGLLENLGTIESPLVYTHSVNIGSLSFVLLEALGVRDFSYQALLPLTAYGIGLYYLFLTVRRVTASNFCGLLTLIVFETVYWSMGAFAFNALRAWHILAFFAAAFHAMNLAAGSTLSRHKIGLACSAFIAFGCGYDFWIICVMIALTILIFHAEKPKLRRLLVGGSVVCGLFILPLIVRQFHVASVMGVAFWLQDIIYTVAIKVPYATKLIAIPSIEAIDAYYQSQHVLRPPAFPTSSIEEITFTFRHMVAAITLPRWGWLTLLTYLGVLGAGLIPSLRSTRIGAFSIALLVPLSIGVALGLAALAPFSLHVYFKHEFPLIGFLFLLAKGIVIYAICVGAIESRKWGLAAATAIVIFVVDAILVHWNNGANGFYSNMEWKRFVATSSNATAAIYAQKHRPEAASIVGIDETRLRRMPYNTLVGSGMKYLIYQPIERLNNFDSQVPVCSWRDWLTHFLAPRQVQAGINCIYRFPVPTNARAEPSLDEFVQSAEGYEIIQKSTKGIGYVILSRDR